MRNRMVAGLALALALAVPTVWAQGPGGPGGGFDREEGKRFGGRQHHEFRMQRFLNDPAFRERIGITAEQAEKLRAQGMAAAKTTVRLRADQQIKRIELAELLHAEKPDRVAIDKKLREVADLHYASLKARTDNMLAMRELLTPEQREKIHAFARERMLEFRGPRGERRMGPGGPPGAPQPPSEMPKD